MPRKGKGGNQPVADIPNQPYGMGKELHDMQAQQPLPSISDPSVPMPERGSTSPADVLAQAQEFAGPMPSVLGAHSNRPGEPVTTGLRSGPGAGTETLHGQTGRRNLRADLFEQLAAQSSDPRIAELARRARMS